MLKKLTIAIMLIAITCTAAMAQTTQAVDETVEIILNPGELSIEYDGGDRFTFSPLDLNTLVTTGDTVENPDTVPSFILRDGRGLTGDGSGWHVNFNCEKLQNQTVGFESYTFDMGYDQTADAVSLIVNATDGGQAINATYGPKTPDTPVTVTDMNADTMVVNTSQGYGRGNYDLGFENAHFSIPISSAAAVAGTYEGLFTATIVAGPGGTGSWTGNVQ